MLNMAARKRAVPLPSGGMIKDRVEVGVPCTPRSKSLLYATQMTRSWHNSLLPT